MDGNGVIRQNEKREDGQQDEWVSGYLMDEWMEGGVGARWRWRCTDRSVTCGE